ncbi:ribosome biogenesis regulatory protein homolog [Rhinatrema bivittatum]|uniref:ribosome biogenesis regulatory protein homolog n=1 Tax=Rhinatrema bivittatum TaxID=194408 RepID=UPI001128BEF1|nr:ribosome biogenesis regulatory protein homolog [Rhinatrema bivittatum]
MAAPPVEELLARAEEEEAASLRQITVCKELELEFDLGNLLAVDPNPPEAGELRRRGDFLRTLARGNTQLLVNRLWQVPSERVQETVVVRLPEPALRLPREKPPPRARPPTRWEEFAKLKGIRKRKRGNLVWDEAHGEWRRRWGYQRANDDTKDWLIEVPATADPAEDQFAKRLRAKKERVARNELSRLRNIARSQGHNPAAPPPPGAPRSRAELGKALHVARRATASAGKFQARLPGEKEQPRGAGKKRQFQPVLGDLAAEKRRQLELLGTLGSKQPRIDVTRAANKQLREDEREAASAKSKKRPGKGRKKRAIAGKGAGGPRAGKRAKSRAGKRSKKGQ